MGNWKEFGWKKEERGKKVGEEFRESYAGTLFTTVRYKFPMKRATNRVVQPRYGCTSKLINHVNEPWYKRQTYAQRQLHVRCVSHAPWGEGSGGLMILLYRGKGGRGRQAKVRYKLSKEKSLSNRVKFVFLLFFFSLSLPLSSTSYFIRLKS